MKKLLIILFLTPELVFAQSDTSLDEKEKIMMFNQIGINKLVDKYKRKLKNKHGFDAWRLQIKFTSKREDILPHQVKFTNLYPEIPTQITFDSPYYKLTAGNFRTKNEALKTKHTISNNFPGAHPISIIIDSDFLKR